MNGTLHVLQLQLLPPFPSSLASIKPANPGSPGKMALKTEREGDSVRHCQSIKQVSVWVVINFLKSNFDRLFYFSAAIYFIKCPMAWAAISFLVFVRHYFLKTISGVSDVLLRGDGSLLTYYCCVFKRLLCLVRCVNM